MTRASCWLPRAVPFLLVLALVVPSVVAAQGVEAPRIPLRTALGELNTLRTEYAEAFNRKDAAGVAALYSSDGVLIDAMGKKIVGTEALREYMSGRGGQGHMVLASDSVQVYGNTAVDIGTVTLHPEGGGEDVARYLSVTRRGMTGWKIVSVAVTPILPE